MLQTTDLQVITTQIDSLHTQVQIMDTAVTHVHVYDTIVTHVYDTIQPDLITVYDKLITAQDNNFDNILVYIAVTVTALIVVFTAYNFWVAKKLFKIEFKKMIDDERENIKKSALEDVDMELYAIKAESARIMAVSLRDKEDQPICFGWWTECLYNASKSNQDYLVTMSVSSILSKLKDYEKLIPDFWESIELSGTELKTLERNLENIPLLMTEREQIFELFKKFKKELPDSMKEK